MGATYGFLLLFFAFVAVGVINARRRARRREGLESLAEELGLQYTALTLGVPEDRAGKRKKRSGVGTFYWLSPSRIAGTSKGAFTASA